MDKVYKYNKRAKIEDVDVKQGIVTGYFSAFGNVDKGGDRIMPGAYAKTIAERGPKSKNAIKWLYNHDTSKLVGKILELEEDSFGLKFVGQISKAPSARDYIYYYDEGIITEHSVGIEVLGYSYTSEEEKAAGIVNLTELKLYEGSSVLWGMNENTPTTSVKNLEYQALAAEKLLKNGTMTDEGFKELELTLANIQKRLSELQRPVEPPKEVEPESKSFDFEGFIGKIQNL